MESLLARTRKISQLLQNPQLLGEVASDLPYDNMAAQLSEIIDCNTYLTDKAGVLLGVREKIKTHDRMDQMVRHRQFPTEYTDRSLLLRTTEANLSITDKLSIFPVEVIEQFPQAMTTVVPIFGAGERLGTFFLGRVDQEFLQEDLVLAEYSAVVVGMQIFYQTSRAREKKIRQNTAIELALGTLSFSELLAMKAVLGALDGVEGRLTTSQIADEIGITRSVIVNALRKLESAGIIESRSLGMKGTYLKILIPEIINEVNQRAN